MAQNFKLNHYQPVGLRGVTTDINDRKQAEEKIRQSERQLAEAQRITHIGCWNWDLQNNTLIWSNEHYRIFGLDPRTAAGASHLRASQGAD